jgi:precorrin-6B methylase 2
MPAKKWTIERLNNESSYWRSCILLTAARLDLFELLGAGGKTPEVVANHLGGSPAGWEVFLKALSAMGLLRKRRQTYGSSAFALRHLNHSGALRLWPAYNGLRQWSELAAALTSGKRPGRQLPFASNRREAKELLESLDLDAQEIAPYLIARVPLKKSSRFLDVGGGLGAYSIAFCRRNPRLGATIVEHPNIAPLARRAVRRACMSRRIRVMGIDMVRRSLPRGFDVVLLSNILHGHGSSENKILLRKVRESLKPEGRLLLRDVFMHNDATAPWPELHPR